MANEKIHRTQAANTYIKLWLFLILVTSCVFICVQIYMNGTRGYIPKENIIDYTFLKSMTPKYPPPLYNFSDNI